MTSGFLLKLNILGKGRKMEIKNAVIIKTFLGIEDHGCFTFSITFDYGDSVQSGGHYVLYKEGKVDYTGKLLRSIFDNLRVKSWEELEGTNVRVQCDYKKVYAIGHLLNDSWVDFSEIFRKDN